MGEKSCTIRTRKFMSNKLLARKQFVSRPAGRDAAAALQAEGSWVVNRRAQRDARLLQQSLSGAARRRSSMSCTPGAPTYQRCGTAWALQAACTPQQAAHGVPESGERRTRWPAVLVAHRRGGTCAGRRRRAEADGAAARRPS